MLGTVIFKNGDLGSPGMGILGSSFLNIFS